MPKMKTHKGTAKRFRITRTGKLMHMKAGRTHLRRKKSAKKRSDYRHAVSTPAKGLRKRVIRLASPAVTE